MTLDDRLQLQELDEELGPGGSPATMTSAVPSADGLYEVDIRRADGNGVGVGLDAKLRVVEIELQDLGDE